MTTCKAEAIPADIVDPGAHPKAMNGHVKTPDADGALIVEGSNVIDGRALIAVSKRQADLVRSEGRAFTASSMPFWASRSVEAALRSEGNAAAKSEANGGTRYIAAWAGCGIRSTARCRHLGG